MKKRCYVPYKQQLTAEMSVMRRKSLNVQAKVCYAVKEEEISCVSIANMSMLQLVTLNVTNSYAWPEMAMKKDHVKKATL